MSCFTFLMTDSLLSDQTHTHTHTHTHRTALLSAQAWGQDPLLKLLCQHAIEGPAVPRHCPCLCSPPVCLDL